MKKITTKPKFKVETMLNRYADGVIGPMFAVRVIGRGRRYTVAFSENDQMAYLYFDEACAKRAAKWLNNPEGPKPELWDGHFTRKPDGHTWNIDKNDFRSET